MHLIILAALTVLSTFSYAQKKFSFQVKGLPVREGTIYKPVINIGPNLKQPINGAEIETSQDSCFALTNGIVSAVFDLGNEFACVVRYSNNLLVTYAGLGDMSDRLEKGQSIQKGGFIGLLNKTERKGILTFIVTNNKGSNLAFEKIVSFIKKNMPAKYAKADMSVALL